MPEKDDKDSKREVIADVVLMVVVTICAGALVYGLMLVFKFTEPWR